MKIGIIGIGNIGGMLLRRFIEFIKPENIFIFDINKDKCLSLKKELKINYSDNIEELNRTCDVIFLSIRPQDLNSVLSEIRVTENKIFVTTVAAIYQETYYKKLGKINLVRIIPSMINKIGGPVLFLKGKYTDKKAEITVKNIISKIGTIYEVKESEIDAFTHLTSCSPAIISEFLRLYIDSVSREKNIDKEKALSLIIDVLKITAELLKKERFNIIPQVCTKGGITEEGIKVMNKYKESFFKELTHSLLEKMKKVRKKYG